MRLLLDEMYPPAIAEQLRRRGHDVDAVAERPQLRGMPDLDLFALAQDEKRAIVTENVRDFAPIVDRHEAQGLTHHGMAFVDPSRYPRGATRTIGRMVTALDALFERHAGRRAQHLYEWL